MCEVSGPRPRDGLHIESELIFIVVVVTDVTRQDGENASSGRLNETRQVAN